MNKHVCLTFNSLCPASCLVAGWCLDLGAKAGHEMPGAPLETCSDDGRVDTNQKKSGEAKAKQRVK